MRAHENFSNHAHFRPKTTPFYVVGPGVELGVELGVCLRFILAACSLEVVYTGKIAITVDTKKKHDR